jgi:hypothetical protein
MAMLARFRMVGVRGAPKAAMRAEGPPGTAAWAPRARGEVVAVGRARRASAACRTPATETDPGNLKGWIAPIVTLLCLVLFAANPGLATLDSV